MIKDMCPKYKKKSWNSKIGKWATQFKNGQKIKADISIKKIQV